MDSNTPWSGRITVSVTISQPQAFPSQHVGKHGIEEETQGQGRPGKLTPDTF